MSTELDLSPFLDVVAPPAVLALRPGAYRISRPAPRKLRLSGCEVRVSPTGGDDTALIQSAIDLLATTE